VHTRTLRYVLLALALLWLALRIPHFTAPFSFDWDSSNYARGVAEFNVIKHQPHPPGYLLWVLGARALAALTGGAMSAQIVQAFFMTLLALAIFHALARRVIGSEAAAIATILLAFSPAVSLYSSEPASMITDLLASCIAGYLAFLDPRQGKWRIVAALAALALLAGFRPSGVLLLAPLIVVSLLVHWRHAWRAVIGGVILAGFIFLAWYVPLAWTVGGWRALSELSSAQFRASAEVTSVFYGATLHRHLGMIAENVIYLAMNLAAWLVAFGFRKKLPSGWRYALWLIPNAVMLFGIHGARAGYWMLSFPPLLLILAAGATPRLRNTISAIAVSLAISYFPYGRLLSSDYWTPYYLAYRSTPRLALDLDASQRRLDQTLHGLQRSGAPEPFVCARNLHEAPNIRTVTYDFDYVHWTTPEAAPPAPSIWLFDQHGPDAALRDRYKNWRRLTGDDLMSLWQTSP